LIVHLNDTIVAISSASGPAPRMIIRASGSGVADILADFRAEISAPGAGRKTLCFAGLRVPAWVYRFAGPRSYTGDDLIELHIPGNPLLARMLVDHLIHLGARAAEPGEFTARAYFNGRIDLSQAEGVAAVVAAGNQAELDAGRRLMAGELARRLRPVMDQMAGTLALIEAEIDFSDQDVRFMSAGEVAARLGEVGAALDELLKNSARMARLSHEPVVVLAGRPNAGKSTLLNALSRSSRAVVSPTAGTTRDALSAMVALRRGMIRLVDVAGLEEEAGSSSIERQMRERALRELERADVVVLVKEATDNRPSLQLARPADLVVVSKIDLGRVRTADHGTANGPPCGPYESASLRVSAVANIGMEALRESLDVLVFGGAVSGVAELALTGRHVRAIEAAQQCVSRAVHVSAAELMAAELRLGLDSLGQILGDVSPDDILGKIFSTFCIGK
jgi:tRNA modification GTPase